MMKNLLLTLFISGLFLAGCTTEPTVINILPPEKAAPVTQKETVITTTQNRHIAGYTRQSRPLEYYVFGKGSDVTFVIGGIHGDEPASAVLAIQLIKYLQENPLLERMEEEYAPPLPGTNDTDSDTAEASVNELVEMIERGELQLSSTVNRRSGRASICRTSNPNRPHAFGVGQLQGILD